MPSPRDYDTQSASDLEVSARLALAVAEVGLFARICAQRDIPVTLDVVAREDGGLEWDVVLWLDRR